MATMAATCCCEFRRKSRALKLLLLACGWSICMTRGPCADCRQRTGR